MNQISGLLAKSIRWKKMEGRVMKSILWSIIIEVYKDAKGIDIKDDLVSVQIKKDVILVKTNTPIINNELILYQWKILDEFKKRGEKMWFYYKDFKLKFL